MPNPNPMQAFDQRLGPLPNFGARGADPLQMLLLQGAGQGMSIPSYDSTVSAYEPPPLPHRPSPRPSSSREAPSVAPNFFDYLAETGIPLDKIDDTGYDAVREKFFREKVLPSIIKNKEPLTATREEWFRRTERPGKSEWPRLRAATVGAAKGLAAPVLGLVAPEMARGLERDAQAAAAEAEKQGVSGLYEMAGNMVGQLPYWAPPFRAAKLVALGVAGKAAAEVAGKAGVKAATEMAAKGASSAEQMAIGKIAQQAAIEAASIPIQRGLDVVAGGVTAGLYGAAAGEDGKRIQEGLGGFVGGAAVVGGFELLGLGLGKFLSRKHDLSPEQGAALEAAARGQATEQQQALVANALENKPQIEGDIKQWVTRQVQAAKRTANPREPLKVEVAEKGKKGWVTIRMKGADGKEYQLRRLDPNDIDKVTSRISQHLEKGGEITEVTGSASAMNALYLQFENIARSRGEFGLPVILRGEGAVEGGPLAIRPRPGQPAPPQVEDVVAVKDPEAPPPPPPTAAAPLPFRAPIRPPVRPPTPGEPAPAVEKAPTPNIGAPPSPPNVVTTAGAPKVLQMPQRQTDTELGLEEMRTRMARDLGLKGAPEGYLRELGPDEVADMQLEELAAYDAKRLAEGKMAKARTAKGPELTIDSVVDAAGAVYREEGLKTLPSSISTISFDTAKGFGTFELHPSKKVGFLWSEGSDPVRVTLPKEINYTEKGMRELVAQALGQLESGEAVRSKKITEALMHPLDKIEALPNGMYRNTFTGEMFSSKIEAIGSRFTPEGKPRYGVEDPTRRSQGRRYKTLSPDKLAIAIKMYKADYPIEAIAERFGVTGDAVTNDLSSAGLEMRSRGPIPVGEGADIWPTDFGIEGIPGLKALIKSRYGIEDPTRRGVLRGLLGGAAKAAKGGAEASASAAKVEALTKALSQKSAESAGYAQLKRMIEDELSEAVGSKFKVAGLQGSFLKLIDTDAPTGYTRTLFRDLSGIGELLESQNTGSNGLGATIHKLSYSKQVPEVVKKAILEEIDNTSPYGLAMELDQVGLSDSYGDAVLAKVAPKQAKALEEWGNLPSELADKVNTLGELQEKLPQLKQEAKELAKSKKVAEVEKQKEVVQKLRSGTVTPGMELQRTPAQLGEEGTGGVMMRWAAERPTSLGTGPGNYWVSPEGKLVSTLEGEHDEVAAQILKTPRAIEGTSEPKLLKKGWLRVSSNHLQIDSPETLGSRGARRAVALASLNAKEGIVLEMGNYTSPRYLYAPLSAKETGAFLQEPREWLASNILRLRVQAKTRYDMEDPTRRGFLGILGGGASSAAKSGASIPREIIDKAVAAGNQNLLKYLFRKIMFVGEEADSVFDVKGVRVIGNYALVDRVATPKLQRLEDLTKSRGIHQGPIAKAVALWREQLKHPMVMDLSSVGNDSPTILLLDAGRAIADKAPREVIEGFKRRIASMSLYDLKKSFSGFSLANLSAEDSLTLLNKEMPSLLDVIKKVREFPAELLPMDSIREAGSPKALVEKLDAAQAEAKQAALVSEKRALQRGEQPPYRSVQKGMELQRTPAQLGEEGEGGVMMRWAAERPTNYNTRDSWVDPKGRVHFIGPSQTHEEWASEQEEGIQKLWQKGWMRVAGGSVTLPFKALEDSPVLEHAVKLAQENLRGLRERDLFIAITETPDAFATHYTWLTLGSPKQVEEFLANPRAYYARNAQKWSAERPTTTDLGTPIERPTETDLGTPIPEAARSMGEAPSSMGFIERPRADRLVTPFELDNPLASASTFAPGEGKKPTITYLDAFLAPKHIIHENYHGGFAYTGLSNTVEALVLRDPMSKQLFGAYAPNVRAMYTRNGTLGEETFVYLAQAIRLEQKGEKYLLDAFIEADTDRETVFEYANSLATKLLREAESKRPSVNRSDLQRKLKDLTRRTGGLKDLGRDAESVGELVDVEGGRFTVTKDDATHTFDTRPEAEDFIEKNFREPLNAPELVDSTYLPEDLPRYAAEMPTNKRRPPKTGDPLPSELSGREPIKASGFLMSRLFRPFYPWVDDVAKKYSRPDLYSTFDRLRADGLEMEKAYAASSRKIERAFKEAGSNVYTTPYKKRVDMATYMRTPSEQKAEVAAQLNMTEKDVRVTEKLREVLDWGYGDTGVRAPYEHDYVMRFTPDNFDPDVLRRTGKFTQGDIDFIANHVRSEELDFTDRDIVSNMTTYFRLGYRWKFMKDSIKEAAKLVDEQNEKGEFVWGALRPLLRRHLDYVKGVPDYTQRMVNGALELAKEFYNAGVQKVNRALPEGMQLEEMTIPAQDILSKYILFSYAGGLGLRPMAFIRDTLQLLTTTIGVLGPGYMVKGMERSFSRPDAWRAAEKYGWLLKDNPLHSLTFGGYEKPPLGRTTQVAETVLQPLKWSNNSNRLIAGWGHYEKAIDAIREFSQVNPQKMAKRIGLHYLDEGLQKRYMREIANSTPEGWDDIAMRISKDMVDFSQWSYRRGAAPGMYEYALGRLFGQYGTWPLNYIEFLRHIASRGDAADKMKTLSQLALSHYAILYAGESAGVDTGTWVGLEPASYTGGPLLQGVQALPSVASTEGLQGQEARRTLRRLLLPGPIPGGLAAERTFRAIATDDPDMFKILLGFQPLKPGEEERAMHALVP